jgi:SAM-dependent methyltransferase
VRLTHILGNVGKNAVAPLAWRLLPSRGSYGMDGDLDAVCDVLERLAPGIERLGIGLSGKTVLELGTGRTPDVLAACLLAGAQRCRGLDPFPQLGPEAAEPQRFGALSQRLASGGAPEFLQATGAERGEILARQQRWLQEDLRLEFGAFDGLTLPIDGHSVDLVLSKSVLEHVAPGDVTPLLSETRRVLRDGGGAVHIIDLRDHTTLDSETPTIAADRQANGDWLEALRYPEPLYRAMFSRRSTAINRLRAPQWRETFERCGFVVEGWWPTEFPLPAGFDPNRLRAPWSDYPLDELAIGFLTVAARAATAVR